MHTLVYKRAWKLFCNRIFPRTSLLRISHAMDSIDRVQECQLCASSMLVHGSRIAHKPNPMRCPCHYPNWSKRAPCFTVPAPWVEGEWTINFTGYSFTTEESAQLTSEPAPSRIAPNADSQLTHAITAQSLDGTSELVCSDLELQGMPRCVLKSLCCTLQTASPESARNS